MNTAQFIFWVIVTAIVSPITVEAIRNYRRNTRFDEDDND